MEIAFAIILPQDIVSTTVSCWADLKLKNFSSHAEFRLANLRSERFNGKSTELPWLDMYLYALAISARDCSLTCFKPEYVALILPLVLKLVRQYLSVNYQEKPDETWSGIVEIISSLTFTYGKTFVYNFCVLWITTKSLFTRCRNRKQMFGHE